MDASQALEALSDPAERVEAQLIAQLADTQLDGTPETEAYLLELVRTLQAGRRYQKFLWTQVNHGKLESAALERKEMMSHYKGKLAPGDVL
jgi:hypothetical protein